MTVFLRLLEEQDKEALLRRAASGYAPTARFEVPISEFRGLPRSPFAYWLSQDLRTKFDDLGQLGTDEVVAKQGLATGDNFRHVRLWWEVQPGRDEIWSPFANGGRLSPIYQDLIQVVGYDRGHQESLKVTGRFGRGADFYGRPGLTWAVRSRRFAPSLLSSGAIFSHRGYCLFAPRDELFALCGMLNGAPVDFLLKVLLGRFSFPEFLVGAVPLLPMPDVTMSMKGQFASLARSGWSAYRSLDTTVEVSHAFVMPALLNIPGAGFGDRCSAWSAQVVEVKAGLDRVQAEIDELCFDLYGISEEDRRSIVDGFGVAVGGEDDSVGADVDVDDLEDEVGFDLVGSQRTVTFA